MDPLEVANFAQGGLQSIGNLFSSIIGSNAEKAHAQALRYAAQQANSEAGVNAQEQLQEGDAVAAHAAVQGAANGGGFTGSTLGIISSLGAQAMFNARNAVYRGQTVAQNDLYEARVASANANNQLIGGVIGAVSPVVGSWAKSAYQSQIASSLSQRLGDGGGGYDGQMADQYDG